MSAYRTIPESSFSAELGQRTTEVSSNALGGHIVGVSDEWFAPASDLLKPGPAVSLKGQFGPKGALFDGWETRRHNSGADWAIVRLGPKAGATIQGFDIDTANFNGNEAPAAAVFALTQPPEEEAAGKVVTSDDPRPLLPAVPCGPSQRHIFVLTSPVSTPFTHVRLDMIPDGGIARFRVYGQIAPPPPGLGYDEEPATDARLGVLDLAHVLNGGRVVYTSDQHFGVGANVLLPGRGKDMGDGWETKRSRSPGHKDYIVIALGEAGVLSYAEINTLHFLGNPPQTVQLFGTTLAPGTSWPVAPGAGEKGEQAAGIKWVQLAPHTPTGPGKQHYIPLASVGPVTHVKVVMHPDGGMNRVRLVGRRAKATEGLEPPPVPLPSTPDVHAKIAPLLTAAAFKPYGHVVGVPPAGRDGGGWVAANQGTAEKYPGQSPVHAFYPADSSSKSHIHTYNCAPLPLPFSVKVLERHRFTSQTFVPMSTSPGKHDGYLVIVALNGPDDKPDLSTLVAFHASTAQAITYAPGVWHHPMVALGEAFTPFACIVTESTDQPQLNVDEVFYDAPVATYTVPGGPGSHKPASAKL